MNWTEENERIVLGRCPRCEERAYERLSNYDTCYECGYSSVLDSDDEHSWETRAKFTAWAAKHMRDQLQVESTKSDTNLIERIA